MVNSSLVRGLIEVAINKGINHIRENPQRGARELADLASHFATTTFQKEFSTIAQNMLEDPASPYYKLVADVVCHTDPTIIKTFGINFGYNSLTLGADLIRQHELRHGYSVPWTILIEIDENSGELFKTGKLTELVRHGKEIGIFTYIIFMSKWDPSIINLIKAHEDCAFILLILPDIINKQQVVLIAGLSNVMVSVFLADDRNNQSTEKITSLLKEFNCLHSIHRVYSDENLNSILNNQWSREVRELNSSFLLLIQSETCSKYGAAKVSQFVQKNNTDLKHPVYLVDLYEDLLKFDRIISDQPCFLGIRSNGDIILHRFETCSNINILRTSLIEILSSKMPKLNEPD